MAVTIDAWDRDRAGELAALCDAAIPNEQLTADELEACCWDDPGVVLGRADGTAATAACTRATGDRTTGFVKVLAVLPAEQRRGNGRALLDAATDWAREQGATAMVLGGSAPFYLWAGIDVRMTGMLVLAESARYRPASAALNMAAPTTFRAPGPDGIELGRALADTDELGVADLCDAHWPHWRAETGRALEQGTCLVARAEGVVVGFACHSVNRAGWVGPIGTDPAVQRRGIAGALMSEVCRDLATAGHTEAEIAWVGPIGFYARTMGAAVSRTCITYRRSLD